MSATELHSGYTDGKTSSRVLRPPGGASSNIFGTDEPNPQQQLHQQQRDGTKGSQNPSPIEANVKSTTDAHQEQQGNKAKARAQYNPITGEEYPADYGQKSTRQGDHPHEGELHEDTSVDHSTEAKESTPPIATPQQQSQQRVRQPPGGKSSGLW